MTHFGMESLTTYKKNILAKTAADHTDRFVLRLLDIQQDKGQSVSHIARVFTD